VEALHNALTHERGESVAFDAGALGVAASKDAAAGFGKPRQRRNGEYSWHLIPSMQSQRHENGR
jgi:hypothetical protein